LIFAGEPQPPDWSSKELAMSLIADRKIATKVCAGSIFGIDQAAQKTSAAA
jgi:hypothetical protein